MNKLQRLMLSLSLLGLLIATSVTAQEPIEITIATWGNTTEMQLINDMIDEYEEMNPNVNVTLLERAGSGFSDQVIVELAAGQAPDIIRAGFRGDFAFYAEAGGTLDMTPYLEEGFSEDFFPAAWTIATYNGKPYGIPYTTDTHALFYNVDYIEQAGITVPTSIDECWSWDEFSAQSRNVMENSDADFGHAALWNGKRWMLFLYDNGGQVLTDDLSAAALDSEAAIETIEWIQSWYDEGLSPYSASMKYSEDALNLFVNGTIGFFISGSWHLPYLRENMVSHEWGVTYLPCTGNGPSNDLGGNGWAITRDSKNPDIAADFLLFISNTENMRHYAAEAFFNPVRYSSLEGLEYPEFNEEMLLFSEVAAIVDPHQAAVQGMSIYPAIQAVLQDELDLAFVGGQSAEQTVQNLNDKINAILADQ